MLPVVIVVVTPTLPFVPAPPKEAVDDDEDGGSGRLLLLFCCAPPPFGSNPWCCAGTGAGGTATATAATGAGTGAGGTATATAATGAGTEAGAAAVILNPNGYIPGRSNWSEEGPAVGVDTGFKVAAGAKAVCAAAIITCVEVFDAGCVGDAKDGAAKAAATAAATAGVTGASEQGYCGEAAGSKPLLGGILVTSCGCTCGEDIIGFGGSCGGCCNGGSCSCCCSCSSDGGRLLLCSLLSECDCCCSCSWFGRRLVCSFLVAVLLSECDDELDASIYVSTTILVLLP